MSQFIAPIFKDESGNQFAVATSGNIITDCDGGIEGVLKKKFHEVFISWDGSQWNEDPVYVPGSSVVALKVINQCNDTFSYIRYGLENFRLKQICCINCPFPLTAGALPQATLDVPYNTVLQIQGNGDYQMNVVAKPDWMTITLNPANGQITLSGTPDEPGDVVVQLEAANCGDDIMIDPVEYTLNVQQILSFTDRSAVNGNSWIDVAYGAGLFVAISQSGVGNRVMTSPDGITWTARTSAADATWNKICFSPSLNLFVAVAQVGIMTSPDGIVWTTRTDPDTAQWRDVIWVEELALFVAVGSLGTSRVMTSPDGINWTLQTAAAMNQWYGVGWSADLGLLVAVSITGTGNRIMTSPDGINWSIGVSPADINWRKIVWHSGMGLFVAVSNTNVPFAQDIMTSPDGINWTLRSNANNSALNNIGVVDTMVVAVANTGASSDKVFSSLNGIAWATVTASNSAWTGIAYNGIDTVVILGPTPVVATGTWIS